MSRCVSATGTGGNSPAPATRWSRRPAAACRIAEGSCASGTSKSTELKLTGVARASLEELRLDYEDFLRQRGLPLWDRHDPRRDAFVARRCATADGVAAWVRETHQSLPGPASLTRKSQPMRRWRSSTWPAGSSPANWPPKQTPSKSKEASASGSTASGRRNAPRPSDQVHQVHQVHQVRFERVLQLDQVHEPVPAAFRAWIVFQPQNSAKSAALNSRY